MTVPERVIHGRYRVIYTIDDTAGVIVSCCRDEQTAALVTVAEWSFLTAEQRDVLAAAASHLQTLSIPGLCPIVDIINNETGFAVVARAPHAHTLGQSLRMRNGAMSESEVVQQTARLLHILQALHNAKPALYLNVPTLADILIPDDGQWVLLPFVALRRLGTEASPYRAPELVQSPIATPASDVYALSALAYHASTGVAPLSTEQVALGARFLSPRTHVPALSDMWEAVLIRGLQDKPSNRYQHATEMQAALQTMAILGSSATSTEQTLPVAQAAQGTSEISDGAMLPSNVAPITTQPVPAASGSNMRLGCIVALAATLTVVAIMLCIILVLVTPGSPFRSLYNGDILSAFNSAVTSPTALPSVSKAIVAATPTPIPAVPSGNTPITAENAASIQSTGVITNTTFGPVAWSPDGTKLAVAAGNSISIHEPTQLNVMQRLVGHVGDITTMSWSPDSRFLASGASNDPVIHVYDTTTGSEVQLLRGHEGWIRTVVFSPDGTSIASGSTDLSIRIWDVRTGRTVQTLTGHTDLIGGIAWSANGLALASASRDGSVRRWDITSGKQIAGFGYQTALNSAAGPDIRYWATALVWTKDGSQMLVGATDGSITVIDANTGTPIRTLKAHTSWITIRGLALNADNSILYSAGLDGLLTVWDMASGTKTAQYSEHSLGIFGISLEPNGNRLVSTSDQEGKMLVWDMTTEKISTLRVGTGIPLELTYSPKSVNTPSAGEVMAISGYNGLVRLHATSKDQNTYLSGTMSGAQSFAFIGPDRFALIDGQNGVNRYTPESTTPQPLGDIIGVPLSVASTPDGNVLAVGGADGIQLWRTDSDAKPVSLQTQLRSIVGIRFNQDGSTMAIRGGGDKPGYEIWDLTARSMIFHADEAAYRVEFLATSERIVVLTKQNTIELRAYDNSRPLQTLTAPSEEGYMQMTTLPNSDLIVAADIRGDVTISTTDGTVLATLPQEDGVTVLAANPTGTELGVGHRDGTITRYAIP